MVIFGLIFGLMTMIVHFIVVTLQLVERKFPILGWVAYILNIIFVPLRAILAIITDKFHPEGQMKAKILSLTTNVSEEEAEIILDMNNDKDDFEATFNKSMIKDEEKELDLENWENTKKYILHLKESDKASVKVNVNDIGIIINAINRVGLRQGLCKVDIGNNTNENFACFEFDDNNYCVYELKDEIGLADLSKVKLVNKIIWIDETS